MVLKEPKFSIIVPNYNKEKYIQRCIESILSQTYKNIEIFVIDNESTDNSFTILNQYKDKFYIGVAPHIYKTSWTSSVSKAIPLITGEYFTIIGADDFIAPTYIEQCARYSNILERKNALCFHSRLTFFREQNKYEYSLSNSEYSIDEYTSFAQLKHILLQRSCIRTPTMVYSKKLIERGFWKWEPELYEGADDYAFYCHLVDNKIFIYSLPLELGYKYSWNEDQSTWIVHRLYGNSINNKIQQIYKEKWSL